MGSGEGFLAVPLAAGRSAPKACSMKPKHAVVVLVVALASVFPSLANAGRKFKVLHNFGSGSDGAVPSGPLVLDGKGDLYGLTGGGGQYGYGAALELVPQNSGEWKETILYSFTAAGDA